jgi:hypothetical protein
MAAALLALDTNSAKTIGIGAIVMIVAVGVLLTFVVTAVVGRLLLVAAVVALGIVVWTQRAAIESSAKKCDAHFFSLHLTPSDPAVKKRCQELANR